MSCGWWRCCSASWPAGFLLVRLPEEVDRTDDHVDEALLLSACRGTPLEEAAASCVEDPDGATPRRTPR